MQTVLAEEILRAIQTLPPLERLRLVEQVVHDVAQGTQDQVSVGAPSVIGLFEDDPKLMDDLCADVMARRQQSGLRAF